MSCSQRPSCLDKNVRDGKVKRGNWGLARALQVSSDFSPAVGPLGEASLGGLLEEEEEPGESSWDSLCTQAGPFL